MTIKATEGILCNAAGCGGVNAAGVAELMLQGVAELITKHCPLAAQISCTIRPTCSVQFSSVNYPNDEDSRSQFYNSLRHTFAKAYALRLLLLALRHTFAKAYVLRLLLLALLDGVELRQPSEHFVLRAFADGTRDQQCNVSVIDILGPRVALRGEDRPRDLRVVPANPQKMHYCLFFTTRELFTAFGVEEHTWR